MFYLSFVLRLDEQQPISGGVCVFFWTKVAWTKFYKPFCLIGKTDLKQDLRLSKTLRQFIFSMYIICFNELG